MSMSATASTDTDCPVDLRFTPMTTTIVIDRSIETIEIGSFLWRHMPLRLRNELVGLPDLLEVERRIGTANPLAVVERRLRSLEQRCAGHGRRVCVAIAPGDNAQGQRLIVTIVDRSSLPVTSGIAA